MDDWSDDAAVIAALDERGVDRSVTMDVDFYGYAKDIDHGKQICQSLADAGFPNVTLESPAGDNRLSFYIKAPMIVDLENVVLVQKTLDEHLAAFGAKCDGWGVMTSPKPSVVKRLFSLFAKKGK